MSNDFADLLALSATTEEKDNKRATTPVWPTDQDLPEQFLVWAQQAIDDPNARVNVTLTPTTNIPLLHAGIKVAVDQLAAGKSVTARVKYSDPETKKDATNFIFSVGERRGQKTKAKAE